MTHTHTVARRRFRQFSLYGRWELLITKWVSDGREISKRLLPPPGGLLLINEGKRRKKNEKLSQDFANDEKSNHAIFCWLFPRPCRVN